VKKKKEAIHVGAMPACWTLNKSRERINGLTALTFSRREGKKKKGEKVESSTNCWDE